MHVFLPMRRQFTSQLHIYGAHLISAPLFHSFIIRPSHFLTVTTTRLGTQQLSTSTLLFYHLRCSSNFTRTNCIIERDYCPSFSFTTTIPISKMVSGLLLQLLITTSLFLIPLTASAIDPTQYDPSCIVHRDVCIIGGGSTGTYSAIRLHDSGQSVLVIEAQDRLGGHTETYTDPATNETIDIGVQVFHNISIVKDYFARFNIPPMNAPLTSPGEVT